MQCILHVVESFGAGTLVAVSNLCNHLAQRGYVIHVAHSRRDDTPADYVKLFDERITLHYIPMLRPIHPVKDLFALWKIMRLIRQTNPGVLHLHSSKAGFLGRAAVAFSGLKRKTFYCPHGVSFLRQDISPRKRKLYIVLERLATHLGGTVVATSQSELAEVVKHTGTHRVALVENAIDIENVLQQTNCESTIRDAASALLIGTVGRIGPQKNPRMFADLARQLKKSHVQWLWIGDGDSAERRNLEKAGVKVTGWLARPEALNKLSILDLYVQTSLWEGMPLSVIEAQVLGVPAIVTDIVGNRDVVLHEQTGIVAKSFDDMLAAVEKIVASRELREQFSDTAKRVARKRFHMDRYVEQYIALYKVPPA